LETFQRDRGLRMQDTMTGQLAALLPPEPTIELDLLSIDANPVVCRAQIGLIVGGLLHAADRRAVPEQPWPGHAEGRLIHEYLDAVRKNRWDLPRSHRLDGGLFQA
jgi:hypothetical protein